MPEWIVQAAIEIAVVLLAAGALWWRVGRLEEDVAGRASVERITALERRVDDNHDGIKGQLGELKSILEDVRRDLAWRRHARGKEDTNPGD